jgi:hypothetical protein
MGQWNENYEMMSNLVQGVGYSWKRKSFGGVIKFFPSSDKKCPLSM